MYYAIHLTKRVPLRAHQLLESTCLKERAPVSDDSDAGLPAPPEGSRSKKDASVGEDSNDVSSAPTETTRLKKHTPVCDDFDEGSCASLKSIHFEKRAPVNDDSNDGSSAPLESIERVHVSSISGMPTSSRVLVILTAVNQNSTTFTPLTTILLYLS
jgi:hypothetical protein